MHQDLESGASPNATTDRLHISEATMTIDIEFTWNPVLFAPTLCPSGIYFPPH